MRFILNNYICTKFNLIIITENECVELTIDSKTFHSNYFLNGFADRPSRGVGQMV